MISLSIDKSEIRSGIQAGFYKKKWIHHNPFPNPDDPDDHSGEDHSIYIYINDNYDITGVKSFMGTELSADELRTSMGVGVVRIPIVMKEIRSKKHPDYKLLELCDGMNSLEQVAEIAQLSLGRAERVLERLRNKGLIKIIKRKYK